MAGSLVLVPASRGAVAGATPVGPGYPRSCTPQEMRRWSADLDRLYRVVEADRALPAGQRRLDAWLATPRDQLTPDARGVVDAHRTFIADPSTGLKGSLRDDGVVELAGGRHRAHYLMERGTDPLPVWVTSSDAARLEAFRKDCHASVARTRPDLLSPDRAEARTRTPDAPQRSAVPELGRVAVGGATRPPPQDLGRVAVQGTARSPGPPEDERAADPTRPPERHQTREFGERTRETGRFLHERDR